MPAWVGDDYSQRTLWEDDKDKMSFHHMVNNSRGMRNLLDEEYENTLQMVSEPYISGNTSRTLPHATRAVYAYNVTSNPQRNLLGFFSLWMFLVVPGLVCPLTSYQGSLLQSLALTQLRSLLTD